MSAIDITLNARLDLASCNALKERLQQALEEAQPECLVIDARHIKQVCSPAMQILLAFGRQLSVQKRACRFTGASEIFTTAIASLGLTSEFKPYMEAH